MFDKDVDGLLFGVIFKKILLFFGLRYDLINVYLLNKGVLIYDEVERDVMFFYEFFYVFVFD